MSNHKPDRWSRREFLKTAALTGTGTLLGLQFDVAAAEPLPETKKIRIPQIPSACRSPEWLAEELLHIEGFTDVQYIPVQGTQGVEQALASAATDIGGHFAAPVILRLEAGDPVVMLGGEHIGCFELLGSDRIATIRDLKGRAVAIPALDPAPYAFLASMASYVGLDHEKILTGSNIAPARQCNCSPTVRSTPISAFPPSRRSFARRRSDASWSTAQWTGRGPSTSAVC